MSKNLCNVFVISGILNAMLASLSMAQGFTCQLGTSPACLDYGDSVCNSYGRCVDEDAICFDKYECDFEGFTCMSNLTECGREYDMLARNHNDLVDNYNSLLGDYEDLQSDLEETIFRLSEEVKLTEKLEGDLLELADCVSTADTLSEAQDCAP